MLLGGSGTGKTHLAAAIANHLTESAFGEVMFIVVPDLLDHLRASFGPNSSETYDRRFDEIKRAPCLMLDDLGTESATPWAREKLYQLLNYRYNALLPTVITTTKGMKEIDPWLATRLSDVDRCKLCALNVSSYRKSRTGNGNADPRNSAASRPYSGVALGQAELSDRFQRTIDAMLYSSPARLHLSVA